MAETTRRLKVFLCHAHSDVAAVRDLFRYLRREGVDVWLDKEKLLPGADWEFEIRKAVRESDVVVVCLSQDFNKAGFRQKEVHLALDTAMYQPQGEIFIIPARLEVCDVSESLSKWQWVDLFEEGGRQKLIYALRARAENAGAALRRRSGRRSREENRRNEQSKVRRGIWIDDKGIVWRDGWPKEPLGRTTEYAVLTYLIEHRGEVCSYESLRRVIHAEDPEPNLIERHEDDLRVIWIDFNLLLNHYIRGRVII